MDLLTAECGTFNNLFKISLLFQKQGFLRKEKKLKTLLLCLDMMRMFFRSKID